MPKTYNEQTLRSLLDAYWHLPPNIFRAIHRVFVCAELTFAPEIYKRFLAEMISRADKNDATKELWFGVDRIATTLDVSRWTINRVRQDALANGVFSFLERRKNRGQFSHYYAKLSKETCELVGLPYSGQKKKARLAQMDDMTHAGQIVVEQAREYARMVEDESVGIPPSNLHAELQAELEQDMTAKGDAALTAHLASHPRTATPPAPTETSAESEHHQENYASETPSRAPLTAAEAAMEQARYLVYTDRTFILKDLRKLSQEQGYNDTPEEAVAKISELADMVTVFNVEPKMVLTLRGIYSRADVNLFDAFAYAREFAIHNETYRGKQFFGYMITTLEGAKKYFAKTGKSMDFRRKLSKAVVRKVEQKAIQNVRELEQRYKGRKFSGVEPDGTMFVIEFSSMMLGDIVKHIGLDTKAVVLEDRRRLYADLEAGKLTEIRASDAAPAPVRPSEVDPDYELTEVAKQLTASKVARPADCLALRGAKPSPRVKTIPTEVPAEKLRGRPYVAELIAQVAAMKAANAAKGV